MAISKGSLLTNSSRFVILAVNSFEHEELGGVFYHESLGYGIPFESLMEAVVQMELIYDKIGYPVRSMEYRRFVTDREGNRESVDICTHQTCGEGEPHGTLATLRICVHHRYNATWQGYVIWEEKNQLLYFESFLELAKILKKILGDGKTEDRQETKSVRRISVDDYVRRRMEGRCAYPDSPHDLFFGSMIQLIGQMERLAATRDGVQETDKAPLQFGGCYRGRGRLATFVIRILFRENATWQGVIYWREARSRLSFRSFLELACLMDAAVQDSAGWEQTTEETRQMADI